MVMMILMRPSPEGTRDDDADDADDGDEGYGCCFLSWYFTGETEIRQAHGIWKVCSRARRV